MGYERPPATTPEGRENQLVDLAVTLAERQLRDGSASAQVVTHFLKLATEREKLERLRLEKEVELMQAKVDQLASATNMEQLYKEAINAMMGYSGRPPMYDDGDEFEDPNVY